MVLGRQSKHSDVIVEALSRLIERSAPILVRRTVMPRDERTTEIFDPRDMLFDVNYLQGCKEFRQDIALPIGEMNYDEVVTKIGDWRTPFNMTGTVAMPTEGTEKGKPACEEKD